MDGSGFDAMTRAFSTLRARRGLAQLLLGAALGGPSALVALDEVNAKRGKTQQRRKRRDQRRRDRQPQPGNGAQADKKRKKPKACPPCKKRKQGKCKGTLPDGTACPGGSCCAGSCVPTTPVCKPSCTGKVCGDNGCGAPCGDCTGGLTCQNGQCVLTCASGLTPCSGNCVDLQTDAAHCGECGETCAFPHASASCQDGACTLGGCNTGFANCDGDPETGCETDIRTDLANCGACGHDCPVPPHAAATCTNSVCGVTCDAGFHQCGDECVSNNDIDHCGEACIPCLGSVCSPATCEDETCGRAPIAGCCEQDGDCGDSNACTTDRCDLNHTCQHTDVICPHFGPCRVSVCDPEHGCITSDYCQADEVCVSDGAQVHCCPPARPLWDGQCGECASYDVTRCVPPSHASAICNWQGTCSYVCDAGWGECNPGDGCVTDLLSNTANCGACGLFCAPGEVCVEGNCRCGDGAACTGQQRCCDGVCLETATDVNNCGGCGVVCEGIGQPTVNRACTGGFCSVSCKGQNYDVNHDLSDGCEHLDEQDNHTQETALDLGARSCLDTDPGTFAGTIYSDYRRHTNPPAPGLATGPNIISAPLWFKVVAPGAECERDLRVEITFTSGTLDTVHRVMVITDLTQASATVVDGSAIITLDSGSYSPESTISFKVEKNPGLVTIAELANFTATFHV